MFSQCVQCLFSLADNLRLAMSLLAWISSWDNFRGPFEQATPIIRPLLDCGATPILCPLLDCGAASSLRLDCGATSSLRLDCGATSSLRLDRGATSSLPLDCGATSSLRLDCGATSSLPLDCGATSSLRLDCGATSSLRLDRGATSSLRLDCGATSSLPLDCGATSSLRLDRGATSSLPLDCDGSIPTPCVRSWSIKSLSPQVPQSSCSWLEGGGVWAVCGRGLCWCEGGGSVGPWELVHGAIGSFGLFEQSSVFFATLHRLVVREYFLVGVFLLPRGVVLSTCSATCDQNQSSSHSLFPSSESFTSLRPFSSKWSFSSTESSKLVQSTPGKQMFVSHRWHRCYKWGTYRERGQSLFHSLW